MTKVVAAMNRANFTNELHNTPDLGPCCACEAPGPHSNILALNRTAPQPGTGWGCFVCGRPQDGAVAVLCDGCINFKRDIRFVVDGNPVDQKRVAVADYDCQPFDHDHAKHPEVAGAR